MSRRTLNLGTTQTDSLALERVLSVLDGAILVISAVEDEQRVLKAITERVSPSAVPMGFTSHLGHRSAGFTPWDERHTRGRARAARSRSRSTARCRRRSSRPPWPPVSALT